MMREESLHFGCWEGGMLVQSGEGGHGVCEIYEGPSRFALSSVEYRAYRGSCMGRASAHSSLLELSMLLPPEVNPNI